MQYRPVEGWGRLPEGWSFVEATSVAVDAQDNVHVFNRGPHPVIVFDRDGKFLRSWGEGVFRRAHGITIGPDGALWLTDDLHHTVFDGKGRYLTQVNNLFRPCGLFADRRNGGLLFVGELPTDLPVSAQVPNLGARVSIVTLKGDLVGRIGGPFLGEKPGEFIAPHGCVVDSRGDLYVAEVSWTARGKTLSPPRETRSLQKFARV